MSDVRSRRWFRVIYAVCAIAMASYVFFDLLDLDGSNLPLAHASAKGAIFLVSNVAEGETSLLPYLPARPAVKADAIAPPIPFASFRSNEALRIARLAFSRLHRCRVALARSKLSDPPSA